jgi:hypothetical protein
MDDDEELGDNFSLNITNKGRRRMVVHEDSEMRLDAVDFVSACAAIDNSSLFPTELLDTLNDGYFWDDRSAQVT